MLATLGWAWMLLGCELPGMAFRTTWGWGLLYWEIGWRVEEGGSIGVWVREGGWAGLRTPFREGARLGLVRGGARS